MAVTPMKVTEESSTLQTSYRFWIVPNIQPENMARCDLGDRRNILKFWQIGITLAAISGVIFSGNGAIAQIVPDRTLGAESSVVTPNVDIKGTLSDRIEGGAIRGANLFHSFQEFNVRDGQGAYFSNPAGIESIFSRVTGNNASNINGKLGVLGNANLFLLNPNGILFGPNASLYLNGSFLGSTANALKFGDGKEFSATNPTAPPLLSVSVPLGVQFNQGQPSAILNSGNLSAGQNLALLGGTVVSTGQLSAPEGQVAVAAVPGNSVVNLSPSAQFLNIETLSALPSVGSSSLSELLTSVDERSRPGLTVNGNRQVELAGSGLPVVDGDVVARNVTAKTATLTANHNLTLVESQIGTTGNLNLLAGNTVRVRDSVANPFVAQAGGNFTIQGNKGIDILALNHPQIAFVSSGNLSLISEGNISGDARFSGRGSFSILNLAGQPGNFVSLYDPIISANGDVQFGDYTGAALKVESIGSIIGGNITITRPDEFAPNPSNPNPSYPDDVVILRNSRALILRAGLDSLDNAVNIPTSVEGTNFNSSGASPLPPGSIQVGNIVTSTNEGNAGSVILEASGNVTIAGVSSFVAAEGNGDGGNIILTSRNGSINTRGKLVSSTPNGRSGDIILKAKGDITIENEIASRILEDGTGRGIPGRIEIASDTGNINLVGEDTPSAIEAIKNRDLIRDIRSSIPEGTGGNITLKASQGQITVTPIGRGQTVQTVQNLTDTTGWKLRAESENGVAGNITLTAADNIQSPDIKASNQVIDDSNSAPINTISLQSLQGSVFLDKVTIDANTSGKGDPGNIRITASNGDVKVENESFINAQILRGGVSQTKLNDEDFRISIEAKNLTLNNGSQINAFVNDFVPSYAPIDSAGNAPIDSAGNAPIGSAGNIDINVGNGDITIIGSPDRSKITGIFNTLGNGTIDPSGLGDAVGAGGNLTIRARSLRINGTNNTDTNNGNEPNAGIAAKTFGLGNAGKIKITLTDSLQITDGFLDNSTAGGSLSTPSNAGPIEVTAKSVILANDNPSRRAIQSKVQRYNFDGEKRDAVGNGGDITINTQSLSLDNASITSESETKGTAGNISITADTLSIKQAIEPNIENKEAAITVTSPEGKAGNIDIFANKMFLNNGTLSANTGQESGANITVEGKDNPSLAFIILWNGSKIEANANNNATGGNVDINSKLLIGLPPRAGIVNKITANAAEGQGGKLNITAGIYGFSQSKLKPSELTTSKENYIAASSQTGAAGIVSVGQPILDPNRGLIKLPEDVRDSSKLIVQGCPVGGQRATSQFVITGRGGLPPNPTSALSSGVLVGNAGEQTGSTNFAPVPTVEAQGVNIGPNGEIILTANPSKLASYSSWQRFTGCDGK
ncbi:filamentous hemagglutinin N-terminal domain-containing protein [uncultured Nostoc sp.]|uniref:two-partner secretion domain-containing protein n=1 Tax=uncultured Nostoc sp. TaxID=340711 RepID=UPI0035CAAF7E